MPEYRELREEEISTGLFRHFIRRQEVGKCWRRENGEWKIKDAPFVDDWTPEDYKTQVRCLRRTCSSGRVCVRCLLRRRAEGLCLCRARAVWRG